MRTVLGLIETATESNHRFATPPINSSVISPVRHCVVLGKGQGLGIIGSEAFNLASVFFAAAFGEFGVFGLQAALDLSAVAGKNGVVNIGDT